MLAEFPEDADAPMRLVQAAVQSRASAIHPGWGFLSENPEFAAACAAALAGVVGGGPVAGWSIGVLAVPMVAGWLLQELVGSWTHLVPSVTPGSPADHAAQRTGGKWRIALPRHQAANRLHPAQEGKRIVIGR